MESSKFKKTFNKLLIFVAILFGLHLITASLELNKVNEIIKLIFVISIFILIAFVIFAVISFFLKNSNLIGYTILIDRIGIKKKKYLSKRYEYIAWADLVKVTAISKYTGIISKDLFFLLYSKNGDICAISSEKSNILIKHLAQLPGFNYINGMIALDGSEEEIMLWEGEPGQGINAAVLHD